MEASSSLAASVLPRSIDNGRIKLVNTIGSGANGVVFLGIDSTNNPPVCRAVKCQQTRKFDPRQQKFAKREIALHRLASGHPSIVTLHRVLEEGDNLYVVMDLGEDGDLFAMITERNRFLGNDELIRSVFLQLLDGVAYLHQLGIAHRDIKPENVVCFRGGERVQICDFGLATSDVLSSEVGYGSSFYIAPECLADQHSLSSTYPTKACDIWSLGILLVNLVCQRGPWLIASPRDGSFKAFLQDPQFLYRILPVSRQCLHILTLIFTVDPALRIALPKLRLLIEDIDTFSRSEGGLNAAPVMIWRPEIESGA